MSGTKENIKHTPKKVDFRSTEAERFPEMLLLAISSPCNLRCKNCPMTYLPSIRDTFNHKNEKELFLNPAYYKKFTDECIKYQTDTFKPRIRISGYGEPLLHKNIVDMISYSCLKGIKTSLITNGQLLDESISRKLLGVGIESIEISVDAHEKHLYESMRIKGNFAKLKDNIKNLVKIRNELQPRKETILIGSIVKTPDNVDLIDEIKKYWLKLGLDHISIRKFLTWGIETLKSKQDKIAETTYMHGDAPCPCPYERILIDPAGWIRLCPYDDQKLIPDFGHLSNTTIAEVWTGDRFKKIRACHSEIFNHKKSEQDAPLCANCEDRRNRSWTFNYFTIAQKKEQ